MDKNDSSQSFKKDDFEMIICFIMKQTGHELWFITDGAYYVKIYSTYNTLFVQTFSL